jgi:hypothetical protein
MTESYKVLFTAVLTCLALNGCGGTTTNPLDGYNELRGRAVPKNDAVNPKAESPASTTGEPAATPKARPVTESFFPPPNTQGEVLNFVEGEEKTYALDMPVLLTGAKFSVTAEGLPKGAKLKQIDGTKYELKWSPKGVVTAGQKSATFQFKVVLKGSGFKDSKSLEAFKRSVRSHQLGLHVVLAASPLPLIQNIKVASSTISEGDQVAIIVIVLDKNASAAPELRVSDLEPTSGEATLPQAAQFLKFTGPPESIGNSEFKFTGIFTADKSALAKIGDRRKEVTARFALHAVSTTSKEASPLSTVELKILSQDEVEAQTEGGEQ